MELHTFSTKPPENYSKQQTKKETKKLLKKLKDLQKVLYAQGKYSLLIILQGLDASGKDGAINKVFSGLNPLGVDVKAFKAPTEEEKNHDFLWRVHPHTPRKGEIMIFNRSHYEDVLVPVVLNLIDERTLFNRYSYINSFENLLEDNHTIVLKFYLHISREEQLERLQERQTNREKFWKHNDGDWNTRLKWDDYIKAYENVFHHANVIPWNIVPADSNWYKEHFIAKSLVTRLENLSLEYPG